MTAPFEQTTGGSGGSAWADVDRRISTRRACSLPGIAKSISQAKPQQVAEGHSFPITVADLSATGARLNTPHELGVGDVLLLTVDAPEGGEALHRTGKVVWAGQNMDDIWCAGVEFTA